MAADDRTPIADGQAEVGRTLGQDGCIAYEQALGLARTSNRGQRTCPAAQARYILPIVFDGARWSSLSKCTSLWRSIIGLRTGTTDSSTRAKPMEQYSHHDDLGLLKQAPHVRTLWHVAVLVKVHSPMEQAMCMGSSGSSSSATVNRLCLDGNRKRIEGGVLYLDEPVHLPCARGLLECEERRLVMESRPIPHQMERVQ
eukprot:5186951-Amphidinium_carterae.1